MSRGVWARRSLTVPAYLLLCVLAVGALPGLTVLALLADVVRQRRLATVRCLLALGVYLACETVGIVTAAGLWAFCPRGRYVQANYALQRWWARTLLAALRRIFSLGMEVTGADALAHGPLVVFVRHTSTADTVIPAVLLAAQGLNPRYVLKHELLADPCLDIVGNRVPNAFVRRDGADPEAVAAVAALLDTAGPHDAVVIYPEGTRFTPRGLSRALERLKDSPRITAARALRHVLPPRPGGPMALLNHPAHADVVFMAHVGFEHAGTFAALANGRLVGRTLRVHCWRVPAAEIPATVRDVWLDGWWARVDDWVHAHQAPDAD